MDTEQIAKTMTADELQAVAMRLANSWYVRYWLHWNYPRESPTVMALEIKDAWGKNQRVDALLDGRFEWDDVDKRYYVDRKDVEQ